MLLTIRTESPDNRRIETRQSNNRKRERNPERRKAVKAWRIGKKCSCGCGRDANTPHHPSDDLYKDEWADLSECLPYYHTCHHMHHTGFVRCPVCGQRWVKQGEVSCWSCKPEAERERIIYRKEQRQRDRNRYNRTQGRKAYRWKREHRRGVKTA